MKHSHKLFILALLFLLPFNTAFALLQVPDSCPPPYIDPPFCVTLPPPPPPPPEPDPVIMIPGITASWNWQVLFHDNPQPLDEWSFPPKVEYYTPLINALKDGFAELDLDPEKHVFIAFYDWRKSNAENYQTYLVPIIQNAKQASGKDKVDIIAHSMGGILARAYIQGPDYNNDVDQFITLGTPHQGSSDVYTIWEGGHIPINWDTTQRLLLKTYLFFKGVRDFDLVSGDKNRYGAIHSQIPSIRDLLPTYNFLKAIEFDNIFLPVNLMNEKNTLLLSMNLNIADLHDRVGSVITVAGTGVNTVESIPFVVRADADAPLWADGKPQPLDPAKNSNQGDNRVLLASALLPDAAEKTVFGSGTHAHLPSIASQHVLDKLGFPNSAPVAIPADPDAILAFLFASPVMPTVTDPNGNHITLDSNSIPGAEYFGEQDPTGLKMILISNPIAGEYKIDLLGNGNGHYDFASAYFKQDSPDSMQIFSGEVVAGQTTSYLSHLIPCSPDTFEPSNFHTFTLSNPSTCSPLSTEKLDTDPPIITIIAPENGKAYRNDGTIKVNYTIEDESEIENRESRLDGQIVENDQVVDLSLLKLGNHALAVVATDVAGNSSQPTVAFTTFVTHESLKTNINHYLALKLIKTKGTTQALIALVEAHRLAKTTKAKNTLLKAFEIAVQTGLKAKLILQPAGNLLTEQMKVL